MWDTLTIVIILLQAAVFLYFIAVNSMYTIFTIISLKDIRGHLFTTTKLEMKNIFTGIYYKPLSIIVPALNEEDTILSTVKSLLFLEYPEFEIIVVNDGSTDGTLEKLKSEFRLVRVDKPISLALSHEPIEEKYFSLDFPDLTVLNKRNGGKADALNAGINASRFPIFCSIDADSILENEALARAARLFVEDREVVATGGIVRVLNGCTVSEGAVTEVKAPQGVLESFQAVEYTRGFLTGRTSWNFFKSLLIISGAFGLFRKDMVLAIGGYRKTVGEDMDLVVRLHRHCRENNIRYKVVFVPDPVCWTQVPNDLISLLKQRNRWQRGLIDSLWHNRKMFFNPRYGKVGLIGFPYFFFIEAIGPFLEFFGYLIFLVFYLFGYISRELILLFFLFALFWGMWINLGSILLDNLIYKRYKGLGDLFKLCLFGMLEFLGYRQLIVVERFIATFSFRRKEWGKPQRQEIGHEKVRKSA
jgi:cellulose synthase/poly-beta-1,6-N-acetylglucosamine synthase-like glycosyltransferase